MYIFQDSFKAFCFTHDYLLRKSFHFTAEMEKLSELKFIDESMKLATNYFNIQMDK